MDYQDVLAAVGAGSAHPGAFRSTEEWMGELLITRDHHVLDVGCGTGRTPVELARRFGCKITGIDVRPAMIRKAKKRSGILGVKGTWLVADARSLPFANNSFDFVITESVNVFADADAALAEYYRVLKPSGTYVDVEMMILGPVAPGFHETARTVYGARQVPDLRGWKQRYRSAGFEEIRVVSTRPVRPQEVMSDGNPDDVVLSDKDAYHRPEVLQVLRQNAEWLDQYHSSLGYGIFLCQKGN